MTAELRMRRAATGAAVLLLHILVLLALLAAFQPRLLQQALGSREITVSLPVTPPRTQTPIPEQPAIAPPTFIRPEEVPHAITPPSIEAAPQPAPQPQEQQGDIRALGRYLYNCSGAYYERLSPKEKAHCLENKWNGQEGPSLTLGPAKPSPYDAVIAKRNAPFVPMEKPCDVDKPTANLGLPCINSSNDHQPLVQFQR
ncbi:MAG TPA: hypothetical protein VHU18_04020 [Rhizomicrobium sp.]|jgi:hypothetical protein|nr:hypothetical protein [Rhizomicrobium sp.]